MSDDLRERIARAIHEDDLARFPESFEWGSSATNRDAYYSSADAVIAALGMREVSGPQYVCDQLYGGCPARQVTGRCEHVEYIRRYLTPWERIEEDG